MLPSLPIRNFTTKKLKFNKPTRNSIDTVSDRDFVLDFLYASSVCSMHISRISEDIENGVQVDVDDGCVLIVKDL